MDVSGYINQELLFLGQKIVMYYAAIIGIGRIIVKLTDSDKDNEWLYDRERWVERRRNNFMLVVRFIAKILQHGK